MADYIDHIDNTNLLPSALVRPVDWSSCTLVSIVTQKFMPFLSLHLNVYDTPQLYCTLVLLEHIAYEFTSFKINYKLIKDIMTLSWFVVAML